ncbi:MAG: phage replisome organizer N-terminal domain-containing protein [Chloroflexota bacterium]|nr:phage replisome organizer N-terminal domain-containing protein [Chloroflexota bacterium]
MGWQRPWIKLWVEMIDDTKVVVSLDPGQRWVWVGLLLVAARSPEPGRLLLPSGRPMNTRQLWHATKSEELPLDHFEATLKTLEEQGMVAWNGECLVVTRWHERQDPETAAQRMQRYRARQRGNGHIEEVTPPVTRGNVHAPETLQAPLRGVTPPHTPPARGEEGQRDRGEEGQNVPGAKAPGLRAEATQGGQTTKAPKTEVLEDLGEAAVSRDQTPARVSGTVEKRPKRGGNPQVDVILEQIQKEWGQRIGHWGKEAHWVKEALGKDYTSDQILACWRAAQASPRYRDVWMPMATLLEDLGEFVKNDQRQLRKWQFVPGQLRGATRVEARGDPKDFEGEWDT